MGELSNHHRALHAPEPIDPDVDVAAEPAEHVVLAVIALGGVVGASLRYGIDVRWPVAPAVFPWTTLGINLLGSLLLPVVVVLAVDVWPARRLLRPALGAGLLGGFTTFSTFAVDERSLLDAGRWPTLIVYMLATVLGCAVVAQLALRAARRVAKRFPR